MSLVKEVRNSGLFLRFCTRTGRDGRGYMFNVITSHAAFLWFMLFIIFAITVCQFIYSNDYSKIQCLFTDMYTHTKANEYENILSAPLWMVVCTV